MAGGLPALEWRDADRIDRNGFERIGHRARRRVLDSRRQLELDNVGRFILTPSITEEGLVLIELEVFELDGSEYVKTHEPRLITRYDMPAEIAFGSRESQVVRISLTPDGR